ncbi:uncharacterized protein A1O9_05643 [Exophiala aquamarina CBS 119918]|uniref:Alpha/beta hydrolase fold-3 domain-containing protein n=1 Tax=Exophiala aquamarina CBS 119918 TaxID=1182545 RepID=A0A072PCB0_9EURO|nr:uncharacterized protein A1O9_05643 [Exophiala aquamarina CBS 119918]KEF57724.1 hypothetical protein A1O9_05643 [Exophiala aquamarina CBS 119918]
MCLNGQTEADVLDVDQYVPNVTENTWHSPLLAKSFERLPPALVQVAGLDPLRDQGLAYFEALKRAGVPVQLNVYRGLPHAFAALTQLSRTVDYEMAVVDWVSARLVSKN